MDKNYEKLPRWQVGVLVSILLFFVLIEANWWIPVGTGLLCGFIGFVEKMENKAKQPKPMVTPMLKRRRGR